MFGRIFRAERKSSISLSCSYLMDASSIWKLESTLAFTSLCLIKDRTTPKDKKERKNNLLEHREHTDRVIQLINDSPAVSSF